MKWRFALFATTLLASLNTTYGQEVGRKSIEKGGFVFSAGHGFITPGRRFINILGNHADVQSTSLGPFFGKAEYAISEHFSFGLNVAHYRLKVWYSETDFRGVEYDTEYYCENTSILVRFNGHFYRDQDFDFYFGVGMGGRFGTWRFESELDGEELIDISDIWAVPIGFDGTVGMRYHILDNFGLYLEGGLAKSMIQLGAIVRI